MTGHEEEWLLQNHQESSATRTSRLINACVVRLDDEDAPSDMASRMLIGDRDYLILQLRRLTLGDRVQAIVNCPSCQAKMDVDFDAASIPLESGTPDSATYEITLQDAAQKTSRTVHFRLPCGADQEAVLSMDVSEAAETLLRRCLLNDDAVRLTADEKSRVIAEMQNRAPRIDLELDMSCPECGSGFVMPFDTTAFFLDELRITASQLLREVHCLALYYHWSEGEILRLNRDRRRVYLAMLSDQMRQE